MIAAYVLNRMPTKLVATTPYELWTSRKLDLSVLRPWGCAAYVHDPYHKYCKLGPSGRNVYSLDTLKPQKGMCL